MVLFRLIAGLVACAITIAHFSSAAEQWKIGRNDYYTVLVNASNGRATGFAEDLELVRGVFELVFPALTKVPALQLRIIVCRNGKSFDRIAPLYEGKPIYAVGFFNSESQSSRRTLTPISCARQFEHLSSMKKHSFGQRASRSRN